MPPSSELEHAVIAWRYAHDPIVRPRRGAALLDVPADGIARTDAGLSLTLRLVCFDGGELIGLKAQPVVMIPTRHLSDVPRALAYLDGWALALPGRHAALGDDLEITLPSRLTDARVLDQKTPQTAEQFAAAFARRWGGGRG